MLELELELELILGDEGRKGRLDILRPAATAPSAPFSPSRLPLVTSPTTRVILLVAFAQNPRIGWLYNNTRPHAHTRRTWGKGHVRRTRTGYTSVVEALGVEGVSARPESTVGRHAFRERLVSRLT